MNISVTELHKAKLDHLLRACVHCTLGLNQVLIDERAALERQDTEALGEAAVNKQLFLAKLEELEAERLDMCQANGFGSDAMAMEEMVEWCDGGPQILAHWNQFIDLAKSCSEMNVRNGAIINLRRLQIIGTLSAIRGESQDNETYSRDGRDASGSATRVLLEI